MSDSVPSQTVRPCLRSGSIRRRPLRALGPLVLAGALGVLGAVLWAGEPAKQDPPSAVYPKGPAEMEKLARSDPLELLRESMRWHDTRILDYTCQFLKVEKIEDVLRKPETMRMKFRTSPFGVYLKWLVDPSKDQEVIYLEGSYKNQAVVHPPGLLGVLFRKVSLDPTSKTALKHSRRPITVAGMANMLRLVLTQSERAKTNGDLTLTYEGIRHDGGRPSYVFKRVLPNRNDNPCAVIIIYIDQEYLCCVRTDAYDWDGGLISHYWYTDLKINPGLTDEDFNPDNRQYNYRLF